MLFSIDFKNRKEFFALMKFVAWAFLATSLIGCFLFLLWIVGPDYRVVRVIADGIMDAQRGGGASNAPIMIGLLAIAGSYLLRHSQGDSSKDEGLKNDDE
jgi:hypothetical protein